MGLFHDIFPTFEMYTTLGCVLVVVVVFVWCVIRFCANIYNTTDINSLALKPLSTYKLTELPDNLCVNILICYPVASKICV